MNRFLIAMIAAFAVVMGVSAQTAGHGTILELTGEVELKPAGASAFVSANPGDRVAPDTIVSTGFKGTAIIEAGSSVITVRPLTRLSFAEISSASDIEDLTVNLQAGRIRVDVKPPAGTRTNFTVQSPIATASVRGTNFEFDSRSLKVNDGKVSFRGARGMEVAVTEGQESYVGKDERVVQPSSVITSSLRPAAPVGTEFYGGTLTPPYAGGNFTVTPEY